MTDNKLIQRYNEIEAEFEAIQSLARRKIDITALQARVAELETKQEALKKTLLHFIALARLKDEAWRTLSYGGSYYMSSSGENYHEKHA